MEKLLFVSPEMAQTLGLEEALLLQLLMECQHLSGQDIVEFTQSQREKLLPFWSETQFTSILNRLSAQGVIHVEGAGPWFATFNSFDEQPVVKTPVFTPQQISPAPAQVQAPKANSPTINDARQRNQYDDDLAYLRTPPPASTPGIRAKKTKMTQDWEPSSDFPKLLSFHNITPSFALSELAKFRHYYCENGRVDISWDVRFLNWVQRAWQTSLNAKGGYDKQHSTRESENPTRSKRTEVRGSLRDIDNADW